MQRFLQFITANQCINHQIHLMPGYQVFCLRPLLQVNLCPTQLLQSWLYNDKPLLHIWYTTNYRKPFIRLKTIMTVKINIIGVHVAVTKISKISKLWDTTVYSFSTNAIVNSNCWATKFLSLVGQQTFNKYSTWKYFNWFCMVLGFPGVFHL